jgi:hypothetical protein
MVKAGSILSTIAVLHCATGLVLSPGPLRAIFAAGLLGAIGSDIGRMAIFWYMFFGFMLLLLGEALRLWEREAPVSARVGYGLSALCLAGGILIPVSAFWVGLVPAFLIVRRSK